jgi:hypothetical protein
MQGSKYARKLKFKITQRIFIVVIWIKIL